nr:hypothetical protein 2 [Gammaproteobacteria bacterium]
MVTNLARVIELGDQEDKYGVKTRVVFGFLVPEMTINIDGVEKQRMFWTFPLNKTSNPEATVVKYMKALNPEATGYDDILGKPCGIEFKHKTVEGTTRANIANITRPMRGVPVPEPDCDVYAFDFDAPSKEVWDKLSENRQEKIKSALNYEGSAVQAMLDGRSTCQQPTDTNAEESEDSPI